MSKNEVRETLFSKYMEPQKSRPVFYTKALKVSKKSGKTLEEFYKEVKSKNNIRSVQNIYSGKNAEEIELMMMQNRKKIEAKYHKK